MSLLDDWNGGSNNIQTAWKQFNHVCKWMNKLGLRFNDKSIAPTAVIDTLGAHIALPAQSIGLQKSKAIQYVHILRQLLKQRSLIKQIGLSIVGKANVS